MASPRRTQTPRGISPDPEDTGSTRRRVHHTMSQFDFDEWSGVNKLLRQHGLPTITLTDPNRISDIADIVVFESSVARLIRENLMSLIHDNDRRQEIIQDLIMSNNQIKSDIERSNIHIRRLEDEKRDLEILLDNARDSIQELEDKHLAQLRHHDNTAEMLRLSRETTETRCKHIEEKYNKQEDELNRLKRKLRMVVEAEESRIERQNEIFQQYRNKGSRAHSTADQRLLDVIDSYESQIAKFKEELRFYRHEARMYRDANIGKRVDRYDALSPLPDDTLTYDNRGLSLAGHNGRWSVDTDPVPNYKAVVKSYKKQLKESKEKIKLLENDIETLKLEMQSRPELKDLRHVQHRAKKLETMLAKNNISLEENGKVRSHSTRVKDIKQMPLSKCRQHLKDICIELDVSDVMDVIPKLHQPSEDTEALLHLEKLVREVLAIINDPDAPKLPSTPRKQSKKHALWCDKSTHHIVPMLQYWLQQMIEIQELKSSLNSLASSLIPWSPPVFPESSLNKPTSVSEIRAAVDSLAVQKIRVDRKGTSDKVPSHQLQSIIAHFQNLFDVDGLDGVYPRMNEIYTKLGETHNVLHTVRELLGLDETAKSTAIVNAVGELCNVVNSTTAHQLKRLLQVEDLNSVISRLQQYEEFFPAFHGLMQQLMDMLNITEMEKILPAVRTLKLLAG